MREHAVRELRAPTLISAVLVAVCAGLWLIDPLLVRHVPRGPAPSVASFVGSTACRACHPAEAAAWSGSHHQAAMAEASRATVLGRFDGARVRVGALSTTFFERGGKFFARTNGPDGKLADYEIAYTFGVYPLQQYLVSLPGGRLQALTTAWDARPAAQGGQRWFALYPDSRTADDELHWTRPAQNWNHMCADCHSTDVRKNYDAASNTFHTTSTEISVGCEACHGPGSRHVTWAAERRHGEMPYDSTMGLGVRLDERRGVIWRATSGAATASRSHPRTTDRELQVCAQCHSRRSQIADGYTAGKHYYDYYRPALLTSPLYYADGQQRGEVYEWGSFLESRMNAHGVTCSDCHDPHSGKLRASGSAVCARCHSLDTFNSPAHTHHPASATGVTCVSCHMPSATYMQVDARRDHSFRVPRPDLTVAIGTPNTCSACHRDRGARWAAAQIVAWRSGDTSATGFQRFATAFVAGLASPERRRRIIEVVDDSTESPIARATALAGLPVDADRQTLAALSRGLADPSPLVRLGALQSASQLPPERRGAFVAPLLDDPMSTVRIDASRLQVGSRLTSSNEQPALERATREFIAAQQHNADRADARTNLGSFYADQGEWERAEFQLRQAIRIDPFFLPAYVNLADVFGAEHPARDADAEQMLRKAAARAPSDATVHHALGLVLVRLHRLDEARAEFARASQLDPTNVRFGYVYAVALNTIGQVKESIAELNRVLALDPDNPETLSALVSYYTARGDSLLAKKYSDRLQELPPE